MYPSSVLGKCLAGLIAIWGIMLIALPVAIIGSNFATIYSEEERKDTIRKEYVEEQKKTKDEELKAGKNEEEGQKDQNELDSGLNNDEITMVNEKKIRKNKVDVYEEKRNEEN